MADPTVDPHHLPDRQKPGLHAAEVHGENSRHPGSPIEHPGRSSRRESDLISPSSQKERTHVRCYRFSAVTLASILWFSFAVSLFAAEASGYSLRWNTNSAETTLEVTGVDAQLLRQMTNWQADDWRNVLSVYAGQGDFLSDMSVPAMLGSYQVDMAVVRFEPRFQLEPGVNYRAVFRPAKLPGATDRSADVIAKFELPATQRVPTTVVAQVYPSAEVLPENLLKFYVHFSASMRGGNVYEHVRLRDEAGKIVELPFLELDEELWNPEMTRLTLFIDPGRIKREVKPLEDIGPALEAGKRYTLEIDAAWRDSAGLPLREAYRKSFRVSAPDREPTSLASWKLKPPKSGTRDALTVEFSEPMDHALALRVIRVADPAGRFVNGTSDLTEHETRWSFAPQEAWTPGAHQLQVQNNIEDLAGNNIGKAFEVDLLEPVQRRFTNQVVRLSFEVR